jgi:hypothetical protein
MALAWREDTEFDRGRRRLLGAADDILGELEELRLGDGRAVPRELTAAIGRLQERLGRRATSPPTLAAAHRLVLALEGRLMGANPRMPRPRAHAERPPGQPVVRVIRGGLTWKLLALPGAPAGGPDAAWQELVVATVERACERWFYAQEQAMRAARDQRGALPALIRARTAWSNYWALRCEAEDLLRRVERSPAKP